MPTQETYRVNGRDHVIDIPDELANPKTSDAVWRLKVFINETIAAITAASRSQGYESEVTRRNAAVIEAVTRGRPSTRATRLSQLLSVERQPETRQRNVFFIGGDADHERPSRSERKKRRKEKNGRHLSHGRNGR